MPLPQSAPLIRASFFRSFHRYAGQSRSPLPLRRFATGGGLKTELHGAQDNAFNRERAAVKAHATATSDLWRKLSLYIAVPALILSGINAYNLWTEHWEHWEHELHDHPLEERPAYPYHNVRMKNYPWGDGDKTLFWNDKVNHHKREE